MGEEITTTNSSKIVTLSPVRGIFKHRPDQKGIVRLGLTTVGEERSFLLVTIARLVSLEELSIPGVNIYKLIQPNPIAVFSTLLFVSDFDPRYKIRPRSHYRARIDKIRSDTGFVIPALFIETTNQT